MKNINLIVLALFSLFLVSCGSSESSSSTPTAAPDNELLLSLSDSSLNIGESGPATITIETNFPATTTETVNFTATFNVSYDTATESDFSVSTITREITKEITIATDTDTGNISFNLDISVVADLSILDDDLVENDETFALRLTSFAVDSDLFPTETTIDPANNTITITIENDNIANLTFSEGGNIAEGEATDFTVTLDKATQIDLTATYTVKGTGDNPALATDFTTGGTTQTVIFPANSTAGDTRTFNLRTVDNDATSDNKGFFLEFSTNQNGLTGDDSISFVIVDNDNAGVILLAEQTVVAEGASVVLAFSVNTIAFAGGITTVTVDYQIELAGDATATIEDFTNLITTGTVVLTTAVPQQTITIATATDDIIETDQTFSVVITGTTPVDVFANTLTSNKTETITIIDDDNAMLTLELEGGIGNGIAEGVADSTTAAAFTVSLASEQTTEIDLIFTITVEGAGDNPTTATDFGGTFPTNSITITADATTDDFSISVAGDAALEDDEEFTFTASGANFDSLTINGDFFTIENDDMVTLLITDSAVNEADGNANFTVSFDGESEIAIPFEYDATATGANPAAADDFGGTFPSGTGSIIDATTTTINIAINDDDDLEGDETFAIILSSANQFVITDASAVGTIKTDDFSAITTITDLDNIRNGLTIGYELQNDLDFDLTEIANFAPLGEFTGTFEGNGFSIANLTIDRTNDVNVGLFSTLNGAAVRNLIIENPQITGDERVGALAGQTINSTIENVRVLANSSSSITGNTYVGGLVGETTNTTISNSWASGSVSGSGDNVGGLVGETTNTTINSSWASGSVVGDDDVGGLVGQNDSDTIISNSWASASVVGNDRVGGLVGVNANSLITISNSWASGSVVGSGDVGGLVGRNSNTTINNSWASGSVVGSGDVGGLIGHNPGSTVSNSYWNRETSGQTTSANGNGGTGVTTTLMITATGASSDTAFSNWNTITDNSWSFGENTDYPTIISNTVADFQLVYQVAGQLRLIPATDTNGTGDAFFGDSNIQDELDATADDFTAGSILVIFDLNARAGNTDNTRADFSTCTGEIPTAVNENLLTTTGVNGTTVAVTIAEDTTTPANWTGTEACGIEVVTQPTIGDELNLTVEITKGAETATRQFKITFE